ncbi:DinB family protein [Amycolatopsis pigmentata]|uniref:DinB family protein n=1 Tax=Amycolatopsis pigmentata TaxID=450801 RepID=A0ABW5FNS3_9PSEU
MTSTETAEKPALSAEKADLLEALAQHRFFLRYTVRDLTDEQAKARTTVSELCLGGLIKHVTAVERMWVDFIQEGPSAFPEFTEMTEEAQAQWAQRFRMADGETLAGLLEDYAEAGRRTDEVVAALPDLNGTHPLPRAPWFEPGARRSARRVLLHIMAETAQHAGHADIIRESLDGAKTMG